MKNFVFISPNFPETYSAFIKALKDDGFRVLGIGDCPYHELNDELRNNLEEYYLTDMNHYDNVCRAIEHFINKYGEISYLESNNEHWLQQDAMLREKYNIDGLKPNDLMTRQKKSSMKKMFIDAGAKVAKHIIVESRKQVEAFINEVGYPVFAKPDIGVGAQGNYKIDNEDDLSRFFDEKDPFTQYIMEQFVYGSAIVSFDGIANSNSEVVFCDMEVFPPSISDIVKENKDVFYYCLPQIDEDFKVLGTKIVKAFGLKKRFFHIEFFVLDKDIKGLGKKGDIIPLEANLRTPGGYTPDLIDYSQSLNVYKIYADVMAFDCTNEKLDDEKYYACSASRRDQNTYKYSNEMVLRVFGDAIRKWGRIPDALSDDLGNTYFMARFKSIEEMNEFKQFVYEK